MVSSRWQWRLANIVRSNRDHIAPGRFLDSSKSDYECEACKTKSHNDSAVIQTVCGHVVCNDCLQARDPDTVDLCPVAQCNGSSVKYQHFPKGKVPQHTDKIHGSKLASIMALLSDEIPRQEKALVFVQGETLIRTLSEAFHVAGLSHCSLSGSEREKRDAMERFKDEDGNKGSARVLIMSMSDECAAGANLTMANHVIFLSPLLAEHQIKYMASIEQAIGRARRRGQKNPVHVYQFVALDTIDVDLLELRERRSRPLYAEDETEADPGEAKHGEMTRLARDGDGRIALVPRSQLRAGCGFHLVDHHRLAQFSDMMEDVQDESEDEQEWEDETQSWV